ncbi:transglycosylase domain-containing protein [Streptomyces spirodelae]|uniref:Penicillin-binding protein n=1 Tax=Streptomyces spirodelae TaxID=2812904 RepID=A0ABS3WWS7_9ACTN|nr:transglycosylase domain-containing protein [Streptomyces spirodelae]MBO8187252.1 penicillin-binding protein [Streptomyces spirodelae]
MSGNRRKPPQGRGRRAAQPPPSPGRRAASRGGGQAPPSAPGPDGYGRRDAQGHRSEPGAPGHGGRAEARRAAQGGGRRRAAAAANAQGGRRAAGGRGRGRAVPERKRFIDYPRAGKDGLRRWIPSWKLMTGLCLGFLALLVGLAGIALALVDVPNPKLAAKAEKNVYYWKDGTQMVVAGKGDRNRQIVGINEIPKHMQWAVIAAENESFYQDSGVDPMGIARAVAKMAMGGETQSGSTITQQYVKNTYLDQSQTLTRKARELLISIKVGAKMEKKDILAGYLNTGYYGRGAYGIQAAAQAYYRVDANKLSASQSAFLAATLNGPNLYDPEGGVGSAATPEKNLKRAKARWSWTLDREVATGHMKKSTRDAIKAKGFPMPKEPKKSTELKGQIGYLVDLANNYITNDSTRSGISQRQLERGGYRIHTTFEKKKVMKLRKTVEQVQKKNIDPDKRDVDKYVQFGGASVRPQDGAILAIYGGADATTHFRNNADYTGVQVGSTFKPFVMAAAMRDGVRDPEGPPEQGPSTRTKVSPKSIYNGDNKIKLRNYNGTVWHDKDGNEWHQRNDGNESRGMITLRTAMQFSVNTPFIQLGMDVGTDKVKQAALDAGVNEDSLAKTTPTFSLGTSAPSAIRMASAYGTFATSGTHTEPYSVTKVERKGEVKYQHKKVSEAAFDRPVADNITNMLETVVQKGTGTTARGLGRPAAGKTGTTDDNRSAWFTGYTPQLSTSIGMWRVNDTAKNQKFLKMYGVGGQESIHGASFPAEIWTKYMKEALKGSPVMKFPVPEPIGEKVYGDGASPSPTPTETSAPPTPSDEPSETPSDEPSESPSNSPSSTSSSCPPLNPDCDEQSNGNGNGGNGGTDGPGGGPGGDSGDTGDTGDPGGNDSGSNFFGGPTGSRRE